MTITVIGKQHLKGTSRKTGNNYDFINVHFICKENGVEGECGQSVSLDPNMVNYDGIKVGGRYNVEFGLRGRVVGFGEVPPIK